MTTNQNVALKYVGDNGDIAEAIPSSFQALTFTELFSKNNLYEINANVEAGDATINGEVLEKESTLTFPINFYEDISIYVLVPGGWLPITFLNSNWLVPDRNFISSIIQIQSNLQKTNIKATKWWLDFHKNANLTINPLLYALEGNKQKKPTFSEFCTSYDKAVEKLTEYFPESKIITSENTQFYKAGYSVLEELTSSQDNEIQFLLETAPLVSTPYSDQGASVLFGEPKPS